MKIVVLGAGVGGLYAAKLLAEQGHDVTVYEKNTKDNLSYPWRDDIGIKAVNEVGIPLPAYHCHVDPVSFCLPHLPPIKMPVAMAESEWHIERHEFAVMFADLAEEAGAKIVYGKEIKEFPKADLIIDNRGLDLSTISENNVFNVYRAVVEPACKPPKKHRKKIYIKHIVPGGVSWCIVEPDGKVNILVGRLGPMTEDDFKESLKALKADNPIISDEVLLGGDFYTIPISRPSASLVADGYIKLGDAAFMTIPLIGSGLADSLRAATYIADTLKTAKSTKAKDLWAYQVKYFRTAAPVDVLIDGIRELLMSYNIPYFFASLARVLLAKKIPTNYKFHKLWQKLYQK